MANDVMKKIIHVDMDCFYAAVEMRDNPSYRGRPLAVGGSEKQRGVLSTCNYEARQFGIRSAMPTGQALKLCPNLLVVPGRMQVYVDTSEKYAKSLSGILRSLSLSRLMRLIWMLLKLKFFMVAPL